MLVIGLTGGIGSGKSTVTKLFAEKGIVIIDTDILAREVTAPTQPALKAIAAKFGATVLSPDGSLNRAALRKIIFNDDASRHWLEELLHPLIREKAAAQVETAQSPYCIVVIPLLFETAPNPLLDRVLVVDASEELQISRTVARDHLSVEAIKAILKTQVNRETRLKQADDVIVNNGSEQDLVAQVDKLHERYLKL